MDTTKNILSLPDEVLANIFSYLTQDNIEQHVLLTCKRFNFVCDTPALWREINVSGMSTSRRRLRRRLTHARELSCGRGAISGALGWEEIDFKYAGNLKKLTSYGHVKSLIFLRYLKGLLSLEINYSHIDSKHLASIRHCPDLIVLKVSLCYVRHLEFMPIMRTLLVLDLQSADISNEDLPHLERAPVLRFLDLSWCWKLNGLTGLPKMNDLRELDFSHICNKGDQPFTFEFLSRCPKLLKFTAIDCHRFDTTTLPPNLNSIQEVYISVWRSNSQLEDYTADDFVRVCQSATDIKYYFCSFVSNRDYGYSMEYAEGKCEVKRLNNIFRYGIIDSYNGIDMCQ